MLHISTTTNSVDYTANNFRYPVPTPINGKPTNKTLKRLKTELHANGSSAETYLRGSNHGYLGIILTVPEYERIVPRPDAFVAPISMVYCTLLQLQQQLN